MSPRSLQVPIRKSRGLIATADKKEKWVGLGRRAGAFGCCFPLPVAPALQINVLSEFAEEEEAEQLLIAWSSKAPG